MTAEHMTEGQSEFRLRAAGPEDIRLLYDWANDPEVRRNSFHSGPISWETHAAWFRRMQADENVRQYIYEVSGEPVGQIRIRMNAAGEEAEISYSIAAAYRGRGHGHRMLELLEATVREELPSVRTLTACVKKDNAASSGAFEHAGYSMKCLVFERSL